MDALNIGNDHRGQRSEFTPKTTKANGNGSNGSHKPLAQVRQGVRVAAFKAVTAAHLTEHEGLTVAEAALGCNTSPVYIAAIKTILATKNMGLLEAVMRGDEPVIATAARLKNAAAAIAAYEKCSAYEKRMFELATGAMADLTAHLVTAAPEQLAETAKKLDPEWVWENLVMPAVSNSKTTPNT
jgi:hypothetical protein